MGRKIDLILIILGAAVLIPVVLFMTAIKPTSFGYENTTKAIGYYYLLIYLLAPYYFNFLNKREKEHKEIISRIKGILIPAIFMISVVLFMIQLEMGQIYYSFSIMIISYLHLFLSKYKKKEIGIISMENPILAISPLIINILTYGIIFEFLAPGEGFGISFGICSIYLMLLYMITIAPRDVIEITNPKNPKIHYILEKFMNFIKISEVTTISPSPYTTSKQKTNATIPLNFKLNPPFSQRRNKILMYFGFITFAFLGLPFMLPAFTHIFFAYNITKLVNTYQLKNNPNKKKIKKEEVLSKNTSRLLTIFILLSVFFSLHNLQHYLFQKSILTFFEIIPWWTWVLIIIAIYALLFKNIKKENKQKP